MRLLIRDAVPNDAEQIGFVHCTAWRETYSRLINADYLASMSPEKSALKFAERACKDMLVLSADGRAVGFSVYGKTRDDDLPESCGDIHAVYLLKAYQRMGYGKKLLEASINKLLEVGCDVFSVWVLESNLSAIAFYEKCGFAADGAIQEVVYATPVICRRYLLEKKNGV